VSARCTLRREAAAICVTKKTHDGFQQIAGGTAEVKLQSSKARPGDQKEEETTSVHDPIERGGTVSGGKRSSSG